MNIPMKRTKRDFLKGPILPALLKFFIPVLLALLLQALYGAVDLWAVGKFGTTTDVSTVATGSQAMQIITGLIAGLSMGSTILIGLHVGRKDHDGVAKTICSSLWVVVFWRGFDSYNCTWLRRGLTVRPTHRQRRFLRRYHTKEKDKKMTADYEAEQERLKLENETTEEWVEQRQTMGDDLVAFIALTKKYVDVTELTQTIVNQYIKKIIIHAPDKPGGKHRQKVEIIFNFVDEVEIPVLAGPMIAESAPP